MNKEKNSMCRIDTDKAWNILHERLENDQLLNDEPEFLPNKKRKILFQRIIAVAAICAGIIFSTVYFSQRKDSLQVVMQNNESSGTLVTTLEDGSTVYLANNASISYLVAFTEEQRKVELNGDALFYVTKDEDRPFIVVIKGITIEVKGTVFAVQSSSEHSFELFVKQGKVIVYSNDEPIGIPVEAGETIQLTGSELSKSEIENNSVFSRFKDRMCFKKEKLNTIIQAINTIYDSPTVIIEESLNNRSLTVTFENNSVEYMMEKICMALNLEYINNRDTIFIHPFLK